MIRRKILGFKIERGESESTKEERIDSSENWLKFMSIDTDLSLPYQQAIQWAQRRLRVLDLENQRLREENEISTKENIKLLNRIDELREIQIELDKILTRAGIVYEPK